MKKLVISAMAMALLALPGTAMAGRDSMPKMMPKMMAPKMAPKAMPSTGMRHNWGPKRNGKWIGGWRAPGGWTGYRPVSRGYFLPSYWISPSFYIGNYGRYGFSQPGYGYGWSRYYDDAVLTDRYGRVQDSVRGVDWDRYDEYGVDEGYEEADYGEDYGDSWGYRDDRPRQTRREKDRDGGLGGAAIGGAVGAATGAVLAGKKGTGAGAVLGGVLGAGAGAAIDIGDRVGRGPKLKKRKHRRHDHDRDYDDGYYDDDRGGGHARGPHWDRRRPHTTRPYYRPYPYYPAQSWGGGDTVITITSQPVVTTHTTTTEEVVYAAAPRKRYVHKRKVWRPRPKPRCVCR